jgi:hypothetical protein
MRDLPPGWATDLAVLRHSGSIISDHGDHIVVRTPQNPDFYWGNCIFVLDDATVGSAAHWIGAFQAAHPGADWVSVGLITAPEDPAAWTALGVAIEVDDVLTAGQPPRATPLAPGYTVRRIEGDDWDQVVAAEMADNELTGAYDPVHHERYARAQAELRSQLSARDVAAFFGAFADGVLASSLGIVACGDRRRTSPPRARHAPARGRSQLVCGEGVQAVGDHHRGREPRRAALSRRRVRAGRQQRPGLSGPRALSREDSAGGDVRPRPLACRDFATRSLHTAPGV